MQNLLRNFMKCSRASFTPQPMLHYLRKETIYSSQQKVLVREPERLLPFTANHLWDNNGSRRTARRLGRGPGSSKGKTAGRGIKGRLARKGGSTKLWFEGGQTPLQDRLPKWGFSRVNTDIFNYINIGQLIYFIKKGRLDKNKTITIRDMYEAGAFKNVKYGVKVLSRGLQNLDFPLHLEVSDASASVIKAIKEKGGSVKCVYRTSLKMKEHIKPYKFPFELEDPLPTPKMVLRMERIRERGAEVVYNQPDWVKKQFEEGKKILKENAQLNGFQIPADRSPGVGANKIRRRRERFIKEIKYDLDKH